MDIHILHGEWIAALSNHMANACDGDTFCVPTQMHLHAFWIAQNNLFPNKSFKVKIQQETIAA